MKADPLLGLALQLATLSLLTFGGASAVVPEMQRIVVEQGQWMSAREFNDLFAIAQGAPGPNLLIVTLVGWHVAGLPGALLATLAFCLPSSLLAYAVARLWDRFRASPWRVRVQDGLLAMTVGLVVSTAWLLARTADHSPAAWILTAGVMALAWHTRINPLWLLAAGGLLGGLGLL
ncbi:chromate transporter [Denitratisoma oestradiolicum]|uniref:Chromate transporter n=1 Tax=Denitratisoma oestradiolicum TaxID=311182 RepID=A0A6S6XY99_9PROT|nr:chromate transporter [Denitratisoma oestradiolicum]TWO81145.1 chromate transporter [Denitratisoma oestradiolicum]CAB1367832.1 Chromate transporter [Denitratisoma oestradiolicum]